MALLEYGISRLIRLRVGELEELIRVYYLDDSGEILRFSKAEAHLITAQAQHLPHKPRMELLYQSMKYPAISVEKELILKSL